jgi:hypothetical protein
VRPIERFFGKALTIDAPTVERISPLRMHDVADRLEALAASEGMALSFDQMTPWYTVAGYNAGRAVMDQKQAFVALQTACASHGFHRD